MLTTFILISWIFRQMLYSYIGSVLVCQLCLISNDACIYVAMEATTKLEYFLYEFWNVGYTSFPIVTVKNGCCVSAHLLGPFFSVPEQKKYCEN